MELWELLVLLIGFGTVIVGIGIILMNNYAKIKTNMKIMKNDAAKDIMKYALKNAIEAARECEKIAENSEQNNNVIDQKDEEKVDNITNGIDEEIERIHKIMKEYDPFTQEYMLLSQRLNELVETKTYNSERICNEKNANLERGALSDFMLPTIIQCGFGMAGCLVGNIIGK